MEDDRYLDLRCGLDAKSLCHQTKVFSLFDLAEDINRLAQHAYRRLINDNGTFQKRLLRGVLVNLTQQKVVIFRRHLN